MGRLCRDQRFRTQGDTLLFSDKQEMKESKEFTASKSHDQRVQNSVGGGSIDLHPTNNFWNKRINERTGASNS